MNQELRLYTFVNFYLSSIQQGIQSAHVTHSLFVKYPTFESNSILWDWAKNDKTMIVLNGGAGPDIRGAFEQISQLGIEHFTVPLPFECFYEDDSLNGMMTAVGVVVPRSLWETIPAGSAVWAPETPVELGAGSGAYVFDIPGQHDSRRITYMPGTREFIFINLLKNCGLAR